MPGPTLFCCDDVTAGDLLEALRGDPEALGRNVASLLVLPGFAKGPEFGNLLTEANTALAEVINNEQVKRIFDALQKRLSGAINPPEAATASIYPLEAATSVALLLIHILRSLSVGAPAIEAETMRMVLLQMVAWAPLTALSIPEGPDTFRQASPAGRA